MSWCDSRVHSMRAGTRFESFLSLSVTSPETCLMRPIKVEICHIVHRSRRMAKSLRSPPYWCTVPLDPRLHTWFCTAIVTLWSNSPISSIRSRLFLMLFPVDMLSRACDSAFCNGSPPSLTPTRESVFFPFFVYSSIIKGQAWRRKRRCKFWWIHYFYSCRFLYILVDARYKN